MTPVSFSAFFAEASAATRARLDLHLSTTGPAPRLWEAMRYAVAGGKLLRPVMVMAAVMDSGGEWEGAVPLACAAELIHAYSLVHDDLPALDDDDERRGRPACHRQFGEAAAILAGDALLTLALEVGLSSRPSRRARPAVLALARAAGPYGMCAGQSMDLGLEGSSFARETCYYLKTGALFAGAAVAGAVLGCGKEAPVRALAAFGREFGLAFQLYDDLADRTMADNGDDCRGQAASAMERARRHLPPGYVRLQELAHYVEDVMTKELRRLDHAGEGSLAPDGGK